MYTESHQVFFQVCYYGITNYAPLRGLSYLILHISKKIQNSVSAPAAPGTTHPIAAQFVGAIATCITGRYSLILETCLASCLVNKPADSPEVGGGYLISETANYSSTWLAAAFIILCKLFKLPQLGHHGQLSSLPRYLPPKPLSWYVEHLLCRRRSTEELLFMYFQNGDRAL
jgi:hypothetical protein